MGLYLNPQEFGDEEAKAQWLNENATRQSEPTFHDPKSGKVTLCWLTNGWFTALGIAYSIREFDEFNNALDPREKMWFEAPTELVEKELGHSI